MAEITIKHDCPAVLIPSGENTTLTAGSPVILTECFANTITVATNFGLARITSDHAPALGADYATLEREWQERQLEYEARHRSLPIKTAQSSCQTDTPTRHHSEGVRDCDRIDCPFCGHMHYPGSETADEEGWTWDDNVCGHLMFLALDLSSYSGFQYRSEFFDRHLGLSDPFAEVKIPSPEDPEESLSVDEIISKLKAEIPGLELRSYDDGGGMACGPIPGGTVTFGFVPQGASA